MAIHQDLPPWFVVPIIAATHFVEIVAPTGAAILLTKGMMPAAVEEEI